MAQAPVLPAAPASTRWPLGFRDSNISPHGQRCHPAKEFCPHKARWCKARRLGLVKPPRLQLAVTISHQESQPADRNERMQVSAGQTLVTGTHGHAYTRLIPRCSAPRPYTYVTCNANSCEKGCSYATGVITNKMQVCGGPQHTLTQLRRLKCAVGGCN